ncbi:hypothetical protein ISF_07495 [Cordyceps fumosorosea ARSEF 2679]|uniref:C6 transcription factor n=1 Tax=Cordyceps fumosorosea (strain ARSEF 2679) TaxID=1081104 RepID=A0A167P9H9_CORFA|nr:hypothetical protein ISF_07495 [Cordyceps fumosorosea ARSEF 2679]OAA56427.1 hypothetical protein ISF_07495 [Cordyceps fumosorosea ARSEF 2679]
MVSTRSSSSRAGSAAPETPLPTTPPTPSSRTKRAASRKSLSSSSKASPPPAAAAAAAAGWSHAPDAATLLWLAISLPLVVWDTVYVLGRPHTMENGWLHWPLWTPYRLYGEIDHVYGWKAFHAKSGFTAAQGALNAVETAMYLAYAWPCLTREGRRAVTGRAGAWAVLIGFSAAVMTLSKTVLYWLHEYYSGFDNIGHNDLVSLIFLWIIPNGAWLVGSTWMIYSLGSDILRGIEAASHVKTE